MSFLLVVQLLLTVNSPAGALPTALCSVGELRANPEGYRYRVERIGELVDSAAVIVRVVAVEVDSSERLLGPRPEWPTTVVSFRVLETLRGSVPGDSLRLPGLAVDRDDYNPLPVPYTMIRPAGQRGDCYAREYRLGAEYLLLLRPAVRAGGHLTPHWRPLAPLNEQVRGPADAWLAWVRARVRAAGQR